MSDANKDPSQFWNAAGDFVSEVWRNKEWIFGVLKWVWPLKQKAVSTDSDEPGIAILGSGGVGKTTLARILSGKSNPFDLPGEYSESMAVEEFELSGSPNVEIVVPPGQAWRRPSTWPELLQNIAIGNVRGILLLSAYGYHSLGQLSFKQHRVWKPEFSPEQFLETYLAECRKEELRVFQELSPAIQISPHKMWLLSIVTKQDLWWSSRNEVEKYYNTGEFGHEVHRIVSQKSPDNFRYEVVFTSLLINNFRTGQGELLAQNTAGYDQQRHLESIRRLIEVVGALRTWEDRG